MTLVLKQATGAHVIHNEVGSSINDDQTMRYWVKSYFLVKIRTMFQLGRTEMQLACSPPYSNLQSTVGVPTMWGTGVYRAGKGVGRCPEGCEHRQGLPSSNRKKKGKGVGAGPALMQQQRWEYL